MRREWEAQRGAFQTVRPFNATLSTKDYVWFWPKIAAALTSKHHWSGRWNQFMGSELHIRNRCPIGARKMAAGDQDRIKATKAQMRQADQADWDERVEAIYD